MRVWPGVRNRTLFERVTRFDLVILNVESKYSSAECRQM